MQGPGFLVGERRAVAAASLSFFMLLFFFQGLLGPPELQPLFLSLTAAYFAAFAGVVAGWFWARWYTMGLGFSGLVLAGMLAWQIGLDTIVLIWGGAHLVVVLGMLGEGAASFYDGRIDWRERWHMDDNAANRLGKAIMRAGASLPYLIMAGLAPREGGAALALLAVATAATGLYGLVRMRSWGLLALAGAASMGLAAGAPVAGLAFPAELGPVLLLTALIPFALPAARWLRSSAS